MSVLAAPPLAFLDDLTPDSGLALRRWTPDEQHRLEALFGASELGEPRLFSRQDYYRLAEQGILAPDERTELIYGRIIRRMSPMGRPHSVALIKTADALESAFGDGHTIEQQMPVQLGSGLEPEPDVMVLPGVSDDYLDAPRPSDILLLVEISDTTLRYDRGTKAAMYAAEGIPEYWLVNLNGRTLEVHRQPESGRYASVEMYAEVETVAPLSAPNAPVRVADLLSLIR